MEKIHHFAGLTDSQVEESRRFNGENILTPKKEVTFGEMIKGCFKFWYLDVVLAMLVLAVIVYGLLKYMQVDMPDNTWIGFVILGVLSFFSFLITLLCWKDDKKAVDADSLIVILMVALLLSGVISFYQGVFGGVDGFIPYFEPLGIAVAILLATGVAFILEKSNEKTFKSLNQVNDDTLVIVVRNNNICKIPRREIVVGDVVMLSAGEEVPADCELLDGMSLNVNESTLTGEPSCHKSVAGENTKNKETTYPSNHIMKGTTILEGYCTARVFAVGDKTECGKVFKAAQVQEGEATPLSKKLDGLADLITKASYLIAGLIVIGRLVMFVYLNDYTNLWFWVLLCLSIILSDLVYAMLQKKGERRGIIKDLVCMIRNSNNSDEEEQDEDEEDSDDDDNKLELIQMLSLLLLPIIAILLFLAIGTTSAADWTSVVKYSLDTLMIAVTLIVVAVPEGLPMAVTLSLAFSMKRLMKQNTLPRTLHACETMGAISVICTDKTGTLTQNQMQIHQVCFPQNGIDNQDLSDDDFSRLIIESISANTTANLDYSNKDKVKAIGSPTEGALLLWLNKFGVNYLEERETTELMDRVPFSTENKYMASVVNSKVLNKRVLYVTGAPDILMRLCNAEGEIKELYNSKLCEYQSGAYRTLALAYGVVDDKDIITDGKLIDTSMLQMMGVVAISDPVRVEVPKAIEECIAAGIKVKMITGDTVGTAKEIGRQVGLWTKTDDERNILYGPDISNMTDDELKLKLPDVKIISRARPNDKERVVRMLKEMGEIVAVTGDGTNDAPALNAAHVGLSMGDGTAVAKEASDMTILDNSFNTIANAVMWGRSLYKNIKRFILFQMTVNVTACLIVLVGAFLGTESPLTVTQMLWVNLIMDTFAAVALASLPPTKTVMKDMPRPINEHILNGIKKSILAIGLTFFAICLVFLLLFQHNDVTSLATMSLTFNEYNGLTAYELGLFFTIFVMLHFWYMFNAKAALTHDSAFKGISWKKTPGFIVITSVIFLVQILLLEIPGLQEMFNVAEGGLSRWDWAIIIGGSFLVTLIGETRCLKK